MDHLFIAPVCHLSFPKYFFVFCLTAVYVLRKNSFKFYLLSYDLTENTNRVLLFFYIISCFLYFVSQVLTWCLVECVICKGVICVSSVRQCVICKTHCEGHFLFSFGIAPPNMVQQQLGQSFAPSLPLCWMWVNQSAVGF